MQWFWEEGKRGGRTWRRPDMLVPDSMARILWGGFRVLKERQKLLQRGLGL